MLLSWGERSESQTEQSLEQEGAMCKLTSDGSSNWSQLPNCCNDLGWEVVCYDGFTSEKWALNSAVECHLHTIASCPLAIDSNDVRSG